jgi:hypothetical protein
MNFDPYWKWLGIPPEEQPADHYRLLGIAPFESDEEVIGNAADRQMLHIRTFQSGTHSELSQRLLNELAAARLTLLDPKKRAAYDAQLRAIWAASPTGEAQPLDAVVRESFLAESPSTGDSRDAAPSAFARRPASYGIRRKRRSTQGPWIVAATVAIVVVALLAWAFRQVLEISIPNSQPHPPPSKATPAKTHAKPQPRSDVSLKDVRRALPKSVG